MKVALAKTLSPGQRVRFYFRHDPDRIEYWGNVTITNLGQLDIEPEVTKQDDLEYLEPAREKVVLFDQAETKQFGSFVTLNII